MIFIDGAHPQPVVLAARGKRKRDCIVDFFSREKQFNWARIRLPSVTRLRLDIYSDPFYTGGAAFITAHHALLELDVSTMIVFVSELTRIFLDHSSLPHLTRFGLHDHECFVRRKRVVHDLTPLLTALATTAVGGSGKPRPIERLKLDIGTGNEVFTAAALFQGLIGLQLTQAKGDWLEWWTRTAELSGAFSQLQECVVHPHYSERAHRSSRAAVGRDLQLFLQLMTARPLQQLNIRFGEHVVFGMEAMHELAQFKQLREFDCDFFGWTGADTRMEWTDPALFSSLVPNCLPCLRSIVLQAVSLSAESVVAIASAAPQLRVLNLSFTTLTCHPAIICAILGGYCSEVVELVIDEARWSEDGHVRARRDAEAADVVRAYQSAVAGAGRGEDFKPFVQLRQLHIVMCSCTPPSMWHALLSLLRCAVHLRCLCGLSSNDSLSISALGYLPTLIFRFTLSILHVVSHLLAAEEQANGRSSLPGVARDEWLSEQRIQFTRRAAGAEG